MPKWFLAVGPQSPRKKTRVSASGYERVDVPAALISAEIPRDPLFWSHCGFSCPIRSSIYYFNLFLVGQFISCGVRMVRQAMSDHWTQLPFCGLRHLPLTLRKARWTMWRLRTNACQCSTRGLSLLTKGDFGAKSNLEVDDMNSPYYWFCLPRFDLQCDVVVYCYIYWVYHWIVCILCIYHIFVIIHPCAAGILPWIHILMTRFASGFASMGTGGLQRNWKVWKPKEQCFWICETLWTLDIGECLTDVYN